jgi:fatty-acyl-CoA synthase
MIRGIPGTTSKAQMNINRIIEYAGTIHRNREVVSKTEQGPFRYTYGDMYERAGKLARALDTLGVRAGEAVTVFGANTHRSVESLYAVPGLGATLYTANPRMTFNQIEYCLRHVSNHAPNRIAVLEPGHVELVSRIVEDTGQEFEHYVVLGSASDVAGSPPFDPISYSEDLIAEQEAGYEWEEVDETTAVLLMFTTGTTGRPKPIAHSHRGIWLHSVGMCASLSINALDSVIVIPALYHQGWFLWVAAPFVGARMVLPGAYPSPNDYVDLILDERITFTSAVSTQFAMMLDEFKSRDEVDLNRLRIYFAGQATPERLMRQYDELGADARQLYGFSECGPHFVENAPRVLREPFSSPEEYSRFKASVAGFPACGTAIRLIDESGGDLPWDGESSGSVTFKALWATTEYWNDPEATAASRVGEDWIQVGDMATMDPEGHVRIFDRVKDAIKSGGEWIPTPLLESAIAGHPGVAEAAVVAASHPKWMERPIALVRPTAEQWDSFSEEELRAFLAELADRGEVNKWWIPDRILRVEEIPKTSVGKFDKKILRDRYKDVLAQGTGREPTR